jgi:DNA-binding HxlR family transcriptional regulator
MVTYGQYCPIARAAAILGDRWTLLIVRELMHGASGFNEIVRGLPGISRSVLAQRMRALERAGVVDRRTGAAGRTLGYRLTAAGRDLRPVMAAAGEWGATWAFGDPPPDELDPDLLALWIARHVNPDRLPPGRTVLLLDLRAPRRRFWLVLEAEEVSVCLQHPGFDVDATLSADTAELYRVYLGRTRLREAMARGLVTLEGSARVRRSLEGWFTWSDFAPAVRAAPERRAAAEQATGAGHRVTVSL